MTSEIYARRWGEWPSDIATYDFVEWYGPDVAPQVPARVVATLATTEAARAARPVTQIETTIVNSGGTTRRRMNQWRSPRRKRDEWPHACLCGHGFLFT